MVIIAIPVIFIVVLVIIIVFLIIIIVIPRADMDTFPTPGLLGFWPEGVLLNNLYGTNFNLLRYWTSHRWFP